MIGIATDRGSKVPVHAAHDPFRAVTCKRAGRRGVLTNTRREGNLTPAEE